jgi:hypothetical protein
VLELKHKPNYKGEIMSDKVTPAGQPIPAQPVAPTPQAAQSWDNAQYQQPQNVQYVVMQQSLQGVSGWLAFFVVVFCLEALGYISTFFLAISSLSNGGAAENVVSAIFSLPIAALAIATVVLISMQKKMGKIMAFCTLGVGVLLNVITQVVALAASGGDVALGMGQIVGSIVGLGLVAVYFVASKRVKATLIK